MLSVPCSQQLLLGCAISPIVQWADGTMAPRPGSRTRRHQGRIAAKQTAKRNAINATVRGLESHISLFSATKSKETRRGAPVSGCGPGPSQASPPMVLPLNPAICFVVRRGGNKAGIFGTEAVCLGAGCLGCAIQGSQPTRVSKWQSWRRVAVMQLSERQKQAARCARIVQTA